MNAQKFNFDLCALNDFILGGVSSACGISANQENAEIGYDVYVKDGVIDGIFICLNAGYRGYKKFEGSFFKKDKLLDLDTSSKPEDISAIFGEPIEQWDDGSEVNMQFLIRDKYRIEFSWGIRNSGIKLDYMIAELE
jgi:hypothetical protein